MGTAGAPLGGWLATRVFHVHTLNGFFNLSTWLTAIAGAEIMLLVSYVLTGRGNAGLARQRLARAHG